MSPEVWAAIEEMFVKHPVMKAGPVAYGEIDKAAASTGVKFSEDYREFIHRYGGAIVGPFPVIGLRKAPAMGDTTKSVIEITKHFREQGWRGVADWAVISVDHAGNPIGLDTDGRIWISDHDAGVIEMIADNFERYVRKKCLKWP